MHEKFTTPSASSSTPNANPAPAHYRRDLPHFQGHGAPIFVTFRTKNHWVLPEGIRDVVLKHCLHDHEKKYLMCCAVVMPDHVHLLYQPLGDERGMPFSLSEILQGIKSTSAHSINRALKRKGSVWQGESFDHVLRSSESMAEKVEYIRQNPVRQGLCEAPEEYSWFWENDWQEG